MNAQTLTVVVPMRKMYMYVCPCVYLSSIHTAWLMQFDGDNHNDIIHMQPGLGNPSKAETKP